MLALRVAGIAGMRAAGTVAEPEGGFREFAPSDVDVRALYALASGFEGEGAGALQKFFARLLAAAGVRDESMWIQLTGAPR